MFIRSFWFHHGNLFYFSLQNKESVVIQINSLVSQQFGNLFELDTLSIDLVEWWIVLEF